jgi:hypothetical protein
MTDIETASFPSSVKVTLHHPLGCILSHLDRG